MKKRKPSDYERFERTLDPHRAEEQRAAARETTARLRERGVNVSEDEAPEDLAFLLEAVERFETEVESHGGDLMMDDLKSSRPDDPHFVLPARAAREQLRSYAERIDAAATRLRHHPPKPE
ncbi:MAG TPA: hypothetical protein VLT79_05845 [Gemmatimonadales bacterium]|nr:hypothetical protein [Gemmatimonadales bacterium]